MEAFILVLMALVANVFAAAVPSGLIPEDKVPSLPHYIWRSELTSSQMLNARQLLFDSPNVYCCESCAASYDYGTFWTGNLLEIMTSPRL